MSRSTPLAVLLGAALAASSAAAQPSEVSLERVIALVRERSPAARALRAEVRVADADVDLAGVYPNPEVGYAFMGRFDGTAQSINGTQHQAWIDFPLLIGGQHDARRAAAAGVARTRRAGLDVALLVLEVEARRAFVTLLAAQERGVRLERARAELDELTRIVRERASAGAQSRYDQARVALEISRIDAQLADARADVVEARASLAALAGRPGWEPRASGTLGDLRIELPAAGSLPAVRALEQRVEAAQLDIERAERERIPEIRVGVGAYTTTDPDSGSVYAGLSMPLPIFDTGEAAVSVARAARDAAVEARAAVDAQARARLRGALAALGARREALDQFEGSTLARLPEMQEMAEASYRLGGSGVFELLDTFRARFELELQQIELLESVRQAEIEALSVTGH